MQCNVIRKNRNKKKNQSKREKNNKKNWWNVNDSKSSCRIVNRKHDNSSSIYPTKEFHLTSIGISLLCVYNKERKIKLENIREKEGGGREGGVGDEIITIF